MNIIAGPDMVTGRQASFVYQAYKVRAGVLQGISKHTVVQHEEKAAGWLAAIDDCPSTLKMPNSAHRATGQTYKAGIVRSPGHLECQHQSWPVLSAETALDCCCSRSGKRSLPAWISQHAVAWNGAST